jgi:hypothetical protein
LEISFHRLTSGLNAIAQSIATPNSKNAVAATVGSAPFASNSVTPASISSDPKFSMSSWIFW